MGRKAKPHGQPEYTAPKPPPVTFISDPEDRSNALARLIEAEAGYIGANFDDRLGDNMREAAATLVLRHAEAAFLRERTARAEREWQRLWKDYVWQGQQLSNAEAALERIANCPTGSTVEGIRRIASAVLPTAPDAPAKDATE